MPPIIISPPTPHETPFAEIDKLNKPTENDETMTSSNVDGSEKSQQNGKLL